MNSLSAWAGCIIKHVLVLSYYEVATTLTNSITGVAAKVMLAILSVENVAGIKVVLPGSDAIPAKEGAVVRAAGVDGVHVGHQDLMIIIKSRVCFLS